MCTNSLRIKDEAPISLPDYPSIGTQCLGPHMSTSTWLGFELLVLSSFQPFPYSHRFESASATYSSVICRLTVHFDSSPCSGDACQRDQEWWQKYKYIPIQYASSTAVKVSTGFENARYGHPWHSEGLSCLCYANSLLATVGVRRNRGRC